MKIFLGRTFWRKTVHTHMAYSCPRIEAILWKLQMTVADPNQSFKCLACKSSSQLLQSLQSLQLHFATEHGVVNLLSTPATRAVLPPASFSRHADLCNPDEFFASCLFCGATGSQEEMKEHLGSRHGLVFQQDWKRYSSLHCRFRLVCVH